MAVGKHDHRQHCQPQLTICTLRRAVHTKRHFIAHGVCMCPASRQNSSFCVTTLHSVFKTETVPPAAVTTGLTCAKAPLAALRHHMLRLCHVQTDRLCYQAPCLPA